MLVFSECICLAYVSLQVGLNWNKRDNQIGADSSVTRNFAESFSVFITYLEKILNRKIFIVSILTMLGVTSNAMADNLLEAMDSDGGYKILLAAIKTAGMEDAFKAAGPLTVFAPTDDAFNNLPKAQRDALMNDKEALKKVISYSIVPNKITREDVAAGKVKSLEGHDIKLNVEGGVKVNDVSVVSNTNSENGVIHGVNTLLMPK